LVKEGTEQTRKKAKEMYKGIMQKIILLVAVMLVSNIYGQDPTEPNFGSEIGGLSKADKLYKDYAYHDAIPLYETSLSKKSDVEVMKKLGNCYRLTSQYEKAEYWYGRANDEGNSEGLYMLYYAQMLQSNEKYAESAKWYAKYRDEVPGDVRADNEMKSSQSYRSLYANESMYKVTNVSALNTSGYDFSPVYKDGEIYFTSSRDSARSIEREHTWIGMNFFDMWYAKGEGEKFNKPQRIGGAGSTKLHDGPIVFSNDGGEVIVTRNNYNYRKMFGGVGRSEDKTVKLKMYSGKVMGKNWEATKEFSFNSDEYSVGHPALTADGQTLYFVSDMPGGYGGTDLYRSKKEGDSWGTPENLGPELNTEGDEMFPYVDSEGELYFSSDGHGGLGGLDIYRVKDYSGTWGKVKNMGAPINSSYDDFGLVYGGEKKRGYFTSDRKGGKGLDDIYTFENEGIWLEGIVVDKKTDKPICKSDVDLRYKGDVIGEQETDCSGEFEFAVLPGRDYELQGCAEGYRCNTLKATTKGVEPGGKVFVKIPLEKEEKIRLEVTVLDKQTQQPLGSSTVQVYQECNQETQNGTSNEKGESTYKVKCDCEIRITGNAQGYYPGNTTVSTQDKCVTEDAVVKAIVMLEKIAPPTEGAELLPPGWIKNPDGTYTDDKGSIVNSLPRGIILEHIYYDFDKWYIRKDAEPELENLLSFLKLNPDLIVEIGSHTDARAPYDYNIKLSERRAKSVVQWLVKRGVNKKRLKAVGYGETQPINKCIDNVPCSEEEHQRNRRTEFRVIGNLKTGEDFDIKSVAPDNIDVDPCKKCPF
jgi:outer membrane protein OmpA-like peptidoglycan-associated protein